MRGGGEYGSDQIFGVPTLVPMVAIFSVLGTWFAHFLSLQSGAVASSVILLYAGAVAGVISRSMCAPLEMVSTLMMCRGDECQSMTEELKSTWEKEGLTGMFKGNGANCLKVAPSRGTQFLVYEFMKRRMAVLGWGAIAAASGGVTLNAGARLFAGGIAGMVAAVIVYPLEVIKTIRTVYPDECSGIGDAFGCVIKDAGFAGFYRGLLPTLIAMFPYVGVEFMVYETLKRRWELYTGAKLAVGAMLLIGALAGAAAQACAHPLDVVRRRMQMQGLSSFSKKAAAGKSPKRVYANMFDGLFGICKDEGFHVLFKGLGPACFEKVPSTAIGYFIYEAMKTAMNIASV